MHLSLFGFFRKNKTTMTDEQIQREQLWELWVRGRVPSPYAALMTFQSEVNNGGHSQYFFNTENAADLKKSMAALDRILPEPLRGNLRKAYDAYLLLEQLDTDDAAEQVLTQCDAAFFEHEAEIEDILTAYAATMQK